MSTHYRLITRNLNISLSVLQGKGAKTSAGASGKSNTGQGTTKTSCPEPKVSPGTKRPAGRGNTKGDRGGKKAKRKEIQEGDEEEEEKAVTSGGQRPKNSKRRSIASKVSYKEESSSEKEEEGLSDEEEFQVNSEEGDSAGSDSEADFTTKKKGKGKSKAKVTNSKNTAAPKRRSGGGGKVVKEEEQEWKEEEDDFEEGEGTIRSNGTKRRSGKKKEGPGADEWLEVYLDKTSSWVCVDVEHGVGMPHLCSQNATAPVTYVVSVDGDGFVKDLGRKYDPTWMTTSRKRRVDEEWWEETLEPFLGPEDERGVKEEKEVRQTDM